jgi:hypothetical protein
MNNSSPNKSFVIVLLSIIIFLLLLFVVFLEYQNYNIQPQMTQSPIVNAPSNSIPANTSNSECVFEDYDIVFHSSKGWKCTSQKGSFRAFNEDQDILFDIHDDPKFNTMNNCSVATSFYKSQRFDLDTCKFSGMIMNVTGIIEMGEAPTLFVNISKGQGDAEGFSRDELLKITEFLKSSEFIGASKDNIIKTYE